MPIDVRKLIFSQRELRQAFQVYCQDRGLGNNAPLEGFEVMDGAAGRVVSETTPEGLKVILKFTSSDPNNPVRAHIGEEQIMEVLITLCKAESIPLPRRAKKHIQKHKDGLAMALGMAG